MDWARRGQVLAPTGRSTQRGAAAPSAGARGGPVQADSTDVLAVIGHALSLDGARYRPGGSDPARGFDCSGFVSYVYARAGIELPHSSSAQFETLPHIERGSLRPGDLVYFRIGRSKRISHVGLFLGGDRFIHASSSRTRRVMVSSLSERYWARHWAGARRVPATAASPGRQVASHP
jgi:cell wall-associated NlpC family hydrolase